MIRKLNSKENYNFGKQGEITKSSGLQNIHLPKDVIEKNKKLKKARDYLQLKNIDAKIIKGKLMVNDTELNEDQVDKTIEEGNDTKKRHRSSDDEDNIDKTKSTKIIKPATLTMAARTKDSTGSGPSTPTAITKFFSLASK